jgi:membrane associated rhomboid family serine protease
MARKRWLVHLTLILGFLAAVVSAIFLSRKYLGHSGTADHSILGLLVLALVIVHLTQRRHTVKRLLSRLFGRPSSTGHRSRQAESDLILWLLTLNAIVSGVADFVVGHTIFLSIPGPIILQKWHAMGVLVLLVYVIVHVLRRRKRLRTSQIR